MGCKQRHHRTGTRACITQTLVCEQPWRWLRENNEGRRPGSGEILLNVMVKIE